MKNFTRPIILVTLFLGAYACSFSQQLKISYDFITNKTTYSRSGIVIKDKEGKPFTENNQPKIKKRDSISVEVRNLNPFVYGCTISMQDSSVLHLNALPTSILSGLTPLPSVLKLLSFGGQFDLKSCLPGGESRGNLSQAEIIYFDGKDSLKNVLNGLDYRSLEEMNDSLVYLKGQLADFIKDINQIREASCKISNLIHSRVLTEVQIKDSLNHIIMKAFHDSIISVDSFIGAEKLALEKYKDNYVDYYYFMNMLHEKGSLISTAISRIDTEFTFRYEMAIKKSSNIQDATELRRSEVDFSRKTKKMIARLDERIKNYTTDTSVMDIALAANTFDKLSDEINEIFRIRKVLYADSFYTVWKDISTKGDFKIINISFYEIDSSGKKSSDIIRTKNYVFQFGKPIYFLPSVGISFSRMFQQPYQYSNKSAVITQSAGDFAAPSIIANYTFARMTNNKFVAYGGTLGIGVSLIDQSINFNLGPSLVIGDKQKILITAGLMVGQALRLSNGSYVGEKLAANDSNVPTHKLYTPGYFLSLSYVLPSGK